MFKILRFLYAFFIGIILYIILFTSKMDYIFKKENIFSNFVLVLFALGFMVCVVGGYILIKKKNINFEKIYIDRLKSNKFCKLITIDKCILLCTFILCIGQIIVSYNIFFYTGWDVNNVLVTAKAMASGDIKTLGYYENYFSMYPNNLLITYIYAIIFKIVGLLRFQHGDMILVVLNCSINSLSCLLVYKMAKILVNKKVACIGFILASLSFGISPWVVIPYTDSFALFIPILSLYLYVKTLKNKKKYVRNIYRISAVIISSIGYFIKPQCAIMLIAILCIEVVYLIKDFSIMKLKKTGIIFVTILLVVIGTNSLMKLGQKITKFNIDNEKQMGITHFLMMSFNKKNQGVYSHEDVMFSSSIKGKKERKQANIQVFKKRIEDMGVSGVISHTHKKMLVIFNDGTFAWGDEGDFYYYLLEKNSKIALLLKSIFYDNQIHYKYVSTFQQLTWLTILIFSFVSCFMKKNVEKEKIMNILWLALIGIIIYEIIFEARARYLYIYVPIYVVVATVGIATTANTINTLLNKIILKKDPNKEMVKDNI